MPFEDLIRQAADHYGIPYELLYCQVDKASSFDHLSVSKLGERGLLHLRPETGLDMGLKEDEFFDVEKNLMAGAGYLRRMYKAMTNFITTLKGANNLCVEDDYWMLALACYKGGLGYVLKAINICLHDGLPIRWNNTAIMLADDRCIIHGHYPDQKLMIEYVSHIFANYKKTANKEA